MERSVAELLCPFGLREVPSRQPARELDGVFRAGVPAVHGPCVLICAMITDRPSARNWEVAKSGGVTTLAMSWPVFASHRAALASAPDVRMRLPSGE